MTPLENDLAGWFGDNLWAIWGVLSLGLATAEMLTLDLTLLMLAAGAAAGGLTALVAPGLLWLQVIVSLAVATAMLGLLRPTLLRRTRESIGYRSSVDKLVGSQGLATAAITPNGGEVKVNGELWSARTMGPGDVIQAGDPVEVYEVDATMLVVYPVTGSAQHRELEF
ncbi:NfeD family protein [Luteococcus sp.]|uniref:NfeD family protein n=1 Tax=Luteococcus sp. TaxID=1969402 RepID=UPI003735772E